MRGKGLPREPSLLLGSFGQRVLSNATLRSLRQHAMEPIVKEIVSLAKIRDWRWIVMILMSSWKNTTKSWPSKSLRSCILSHSKKLWRRV
ncbi:hypothetical protein AVEN_191114-1 [Araneus ventricosus]|uniref:Uncharacterized protein n=1 Tax=Araneus ventricosus TaxID=182803 RepID=A0A4Y2B045_ARAVE|nr:hypothetical protein AVEN_191114-1 [Araneus ventricosus]